MVQGEERTVPTEQTMRIRRTARVLLIDAAKRILLFHVHDGTSVHVNRPEMTVYWLTPGGGVEPGETFEQAAVRELGEETGVWLDAPGPCIWRYERLVNGSEGPMRLDERFFLAQVDAPAISLAALLPYEQLTHRAYRWWTPDELEHSTELFLPPSLPTLIRPVLCGRIPPEPEWVR